VKFEIQIFANIDRIRPNRCSHFEP